MPKVPTKKLRTLKKIGEKSAGAIIFYKEKDKILYLILSYTPEKEGKLKKEYWAFAKGHIEVGENKMQAAKREIEEETGLKDLNFISGFELKDEYFFRKGKNVIYKQVVYYLAETKNKDIKISNEHDDFKWLPYEEAVGKITFPQAKEILQKADEFLVLLNRRA